MTDVTRATPERRVLSSFTEDDWAMVFAVDPKLKDRLHQMLATANEA